MVAIKTHYNGKSIVLPKEFKGRPPGDVIVIFEHEETATDDRIAWMKAQEATFSKAWDNDADSIYDDL